MTNRVSLKCQCGQVRGVAENVSATTGNRAICYCDDCQAFAHFLERSDVLDTWGGTDIYQMPPNRVRITEGAEHVECVRLSEKGTYRWYAGCCRTPIGNTVSPRVPFVGVVHVFMDHAGDGRSRDEVLGKPTGYVQGRFAVNGPPPPYVHPRAPLGVILHAVRMVFGWWIMGRGKPSPFFDDATGAPCVTPRVLTPTERAALQPR